MGVKSVLLGMLAAMIIVTLPLRATELSSEVVLAEAGGVSPDLQSLAVELRPSIGGRRLTYAVSGDPTGVGAAGFTRLPRVYGTPAPGNRVSAQLRVVTPGTASLAFQWLLDGAAVAGAAGPSYAIRPEDDGRALSVRVLVEAAASGAVSAESAAVRVSYPKPRVTAQPQELAFRAMDGAVIVEMAAYFNSAGPGTWTVDRPYAAITADGLLTIDPRGVQGTDILSVAYATAKGSATVAVSLRRIAPPRWNVTAVKGININPRPGDFQGDTLGLTAARRDALVFAGYDALRLWIDPQPVIDAATPAARDAAVAAIVAKIGEGAASGFRICAQLGPGDAMRDGLAAGSGVAGYASAAAAIAAAIERAFPDGSVMLDLLNEPFRGSGDYPADIVAIWSAARSAAPDLTLGVEPRPLAYAPGLLELDPSDFDANTLFVIHGYDPGLLTHQQNYPGLPQIPYPVGLREGGLDQALSDMRAIVTADTTLDAAGKAARIEARSNDLAYLFWGNGIDRSFIAGLLDQVDSWRNLHGVAADRILLNEFGFIGRDQWSGPYHYDDLGSRARYMGDWRREVEARGYAGWMAYQALGDFEMFEQTGVTTAGDRLIVEISEALGMTLPVPGPIVGLTALSTGLDHVVLGFTPARDATRHEVSRDGTTWIDLGADRRVSGLVPGQPTLLHLRGANADSVGPETSLTVTVP